MESVFSKTFGNTLGSPGVPWVLGAGQLANNPLAWMFGEVAIDPPKHGNRVCLGNFVKGAGDLHALRHKASADSCFK